MTLTNEQYKSVQIELGSPEMMSLSGSIKANGMLDVPPPNPCFDFRSSRRIREVNRTLQGMRIKKGQTVVVLEHPDYIQLQQDYLDSKSQLEFLETEYNRQLDSSKENVNALKSLQQAKANYFATKAKYEGLKSKLKLVNINPAEIENGEIKSTVNIPSPIEGFVSQVNVNIGMHVNPTDIMFRIVDTDHVHAEAQVFEKDIPKLKIGQLARITLANENHERKAKVYLIGREITSERTVRVHCHLEGEDPNLIPGTFFSAIIETGTNMVSAIPIDAVVNFNGKFFVFIEKDATKHSYELLEINSGAIGNGFQEFSRMTKTSSENYKNKIVVKGSFELLNLLKNVEDD
ncbi:MAG: efflux RND transporter periplasmic adaptor subunit [Cyclobacteriaceae bacterium]